MRCAPWSLALLLANLVLGEVAIAQHRCQLIADLYPGSGSGVSGGIRASDGVRVVFPGGSWQTGSELCIADPSGIQILDRIHGRDGIRPLAGPVSFYNGKEIVRLFTANDSTHGYEPWVTDLTVAGTRMLVDINPGPASGAAQVWTVHGQFAYFGAIVGSAVHLYRTDGTSAGTVPLTTTAMGIRRLGLLTPSGDRVFFVADTPAHGMELWQTDGTPAGTRLVKDIAPGPNGSFPRSLTACDGAVYFSASANATVAREVWMSDGTAAGTVLLNINPGTIGSNPGPIACSGRRVFFAAHHGATWGRELFSVLNGRPALVKDLVTGIGSSDPDIFAPAGDTLYFFAKDATGRPGLYVTDGTAIATRLVHALPTTIKSIRFPIATHGGLYFSAEDRGVDQLYFTDGSANGLRTVCNIRVHLQPALAGGTLYFAGLTTGTGLELYKIDGRHGSVELLHVGCIPTALECTTPRIGRSVKMTGRAAPPAPGILLIGAYQAPVPVPGLTRPGCPLWIDLRAFVYLPQPQSRTWQRTAAIPNDATLLGQQLVLQSAYAPAPLALSNGLKLTIGQ